MANKDVLDKVTKLVALATDKGASEDEARSSAMAAVKLMAEEKLTVVPIADIERINARVEGIVREAKRDATQKMAFGAMLGFVASKYLKV